MERLTEKAFKPSVNSKYVKKKGFYTADCIERLGAYEDTGLTPPEIRELKERNTPKEAIYEIYGDQGDGEDPDAWICPNCEAVYDIDDDYDFCPDCGQMILR